MMTDLVRLEYLKPYGWALGYTAIGMEDPQRYVTGLAQERDIISRCIVLDDRLQATDTVYLPDTIPDPLPVNKLPALRPITECSLCGQPHETKWACIL